MNISLGTVEQVRMFPGKPEFGILGNASIEFKDGAKLNGLVIRGSENGPWVGWPGHKGKDGKWYDTFWLGKEQKEYLNMLVLDKYQEGQNANPEPWE